MVASLVWLAAALWGQKWESAFFAALVAIAIFMGLRTRPLELAFHVGQREQHRVVFRFNKFWGNLSITVDGDPVVRDLRMFSVKLMKTYRFSVGAAEVHDVRIEKDRKLLLAGGRAQPVRAYVDDEL